MRVTKLNGTKLVWVNIKKYLIDWNKAPSKEQFVLQKFIYEYWKNSVILAEFRIPGSLLRIDILNVNKRLVLEYSPESHHNTYNKFFHKNKFGLLGSLKRDFAKQQWAERNGFKWMEITEKDLNKLSYQFFIDTYEIYL